VEVRREDGKLEANGAGPPRPDPARLLPRLPSPIPWISTEPVSEAPPVSGPTSHRGCGAYHAGASQVRELTRRVVRMRPEVPPSDEASN
jgi:hypothetical protein